METDFGAAHALTAMTPDHDGRRYAGTVMLSALPHAPTIRRRTARERLIDVARHAVFRRGAAASPRDTVIRMRSATPARRKSRAVVRNTRDPGALK